jgi:hypothetical protein
VNALAIGLIVLGCSFVSALIGMLLHSRLPDSHLDAESRDIVKLVMGLIATMSALVLSLLIASANTAHDLQNSELRALSANIVLLDRSLELYGPGAKPVRDGLRDLVRQTHDRIWSPKGARPEALNSQQTRNSARSGFELLQNLSPKTDEERTMKSRALVESESLAQSRVLMFEQRGTSISWPFLTVLIFWVCVLFLGFGLLVRFNATVAVTLFVGALSVAGAIFLILELSNPYRGLMRISDEPLRDALTQIDR